MVSRFGEARGSACFLRAPAQPSAAGEGFGQAFEVELRFALRLRVFPFSQIVPLIPAHHFFGCDTPEIGAIIRENSFDVFVIFGWFLKSFWQAARACRQRGIPILVRGDSQLNTDRSSLKRAVKRITHRNALRQFDGFLSVGERNREYLMHYGISEERIFLRPAFRG